MIEGKLEKAKVVADAIGIVFQEHKPTLVEGFLALGCVMRSLGEFFYDREDITLASVFEDYKKSPNLPGALIIHADQVWEILKIFTKMKTVEETGEENE